MIDADGYLHVLGRTDDVINVSGVRISTGALEEVLSSHEDVVEAAVVGLDDEFRGQIPIGVVVLQKNPSKSQETIHNELLQRVRDKIGPVAYFKHLGFTPQLPKTRSGKVLRNVIRNILHGRPPNPPGTIEDLATIDLIHTALKAIGFPKETPKSFEL